MDGWGFGCEFGTYQRFNGLEPLGLLRWASINPRDLIRALNDSFEKVDLMSTLQVYCASGNDWQFVQKAYDMRVDHTYLPTAKFTADQAAVKICRSLAFLRRKILEDLALGDKIFVYRVYDYILPDEEISEIGQSIARLGSATFLCVQKCLERAFTVERFSHNSYVGFIDRFAPLEPVGNRPQSRRMGARFAESSRSLSSNAS